MSVEKSSISNNFPPEDVHNHNESAKLKQISFDVDFITVPLKYRNSQNGVEPQLNTEINASIYFGLRKDRYHIGYIENPLGIKYREIKHFGFSLGLFTGLGSSAITPTTTNDFINHEYDGIIWNKGLAGIFALNSFTLGVALGFDNLLDRNRSIWIYESKPWLGFTLGLNIN